MPTLEEVMTDWRKDQLHKRGLPCEYVSTSINELSNYDFLIELSNALDELKAAGYFK